MVRLELPGIDPDRITLEIEGRVLRVCGTRQEQRPPDAVYHQMEISYGRFERLVSLPPEVDITRASADYNSGYLEIKLPLKGQSRSRQIPISRTRIARTAMGVTTYERARRRLRLQLARAHPGRHRHARRCPATTS